MYFSMFKKLLFFFIITLFLGHDSTAQKRELSIIGYYAGPAYMLDSFPVQRLTHLIFSFGHLKGNRLSIGNADDTACIQKMVSLKKKYRGLKIILSLGGWGGCQYCSPVFSSEEGRNEFASSTRELLEYFHADGIDLDWEYPAIPGYPGHAYAPVDKENFTLLIQSLRHILGKTYEISFAAGGSDPFIDSSIEWKKVMQIADKVNLMSYDLVHGYSSVSGHHTPLYSTPQQEMSTDHAVKKMLAAGVPARKIVIGSAFYARLFKTNSIANHGLYDSAGFYESLSFSQLHDSISVTNGFVQYWDPVAKAPYAFNADRMLLATYDDSASIHLKTKYAINRHLNGIMFWQLMNDKRSNGLLDVMYNVKMRGK